MRNPEQTIGNLIDKQAVAYLSSVDEEGYPNTKAMYKPRIREGIQVFYFSTNTSSLRVSQFKKNAKACIYFADRRFFRGVMLSGNIEVLEDEEIKQRCWEDSDIRYYPQGVSDPDYCILKFIARKGRYYAGFKSQNFEIE